jgi:DNA topoisomerase IA
VFRTPSELSSVLRGNEFKLYDLIWKRTVASQMADARGSTASVTITAPTDTAGTAEFTASGTVITFRGFLAAYEEGHDEERNEQDAGASDEQRSLPPLTVGQVLDLGSLEAKGHETSPPPRYTEASLVKATGGARHRAAVDLRQHHLHHHRSRLRDPTGHGAGAELDRLQRRPPAGAALRRPGRVRLHG